MVSYMPRAGWAGGMLSASKLYQSDLGLGALGHGEAHADEDVLELGPGLGHEVQVAARRRRAHLGRDDLGQVEAVGGQRRGPLALGQLGSPRGQLGLEAAAHLVQPAAGLLARPRDRGRPGSRWARVSAERLPRNSVSTCARASVDGAAAMARSPSSAMPSMSRSTLSVTMSKCRLLPPPVGDATCPGTTAPALSGRLEADDGAGHADVERLGPPLHGDGDRAVERGAQVGIEPRRLVAEEQRRGHGPVEVGVVLAARTTVASVRKPAAASSGATSAGSCRTAKGTWKSDPAEARTVLGLYGSTESPAKITAVDPEASAARSTVPALPGSRTSTRTTISGPASGRPRPAPAGGSSSIGQHGQHRLGRDRVGHPLEHARPRGGRPGRPAALARRQTSWVAPSSAPSGDDVDRLDGRAGVEGAADELGALGDEGALGPAGRTLLQQPAQPADPPVREGQPLGQEATSADGASASASCAVCTSAPNAAGSLTARSARTLRSTSTPARWSPLMRRL